MSPGLFGYWRDASGNPRVTRDAAGVPTYSSGERVQLEAFHFFFLSLLSWRTLVR